MSRAKLLISGFPVRVRGGSPLESTTSGQKKPLAASSEEGSRQTAATRNASELTRLLSRYLGEPSPVQACPTQGETCPGCPDCWAARRGARRVVGALACLLLLVLPGPVANAQEPGLEVTTADRQLPPAPIPLDVSVEIHSRSLPVILRLETFCPDERDCRLTWTTLRCIGGTCVPHRITQSYSNPYRACFRPTTGGRYLVRVRMETCEPPPDGGTRPDICAVWVQRGETGVNFRF